MLVFVYKIFFDICKNLLRLVMWNSFFFFFNNRFLLISIFIYALSCLNVCLCICCGCFV